jgi:uncharacterized delta-60 repeat protein
MRLFSRPRLRHKPKVLAAPTWRPRLEPLEDRSVPAGGALDPSFGNGAGYVATSVSAYGSGAAAVLIQPDGKILAAGDAALGSADASPPDVFAVVRYQADGSLDTSFGTGGHAFADFPGAAFHGWRYSIANAAALYPQSGTANDGKIVLAGEHDTKYGAVFALARFNANGTLDSTFGSDKKNPGEVTTTFSTTGDPYQEAFGVVIQPDGKIVVGGTTSDGAFILARYTTAGALDKTFGTGGVVMTAFSGGVLSAGTLLSQPDGKLLVVGETHPVSQTWVVSLARYNSNGSLDTSFGTSGQVTSPVVVNNAGVKAAIYLPGTANAGEIAVVGQTAGSSGGYVEVARFTDKGALDATFGSGGTTTGQLGSNPAVAIAADGKLVVSFDSQTSTDTTSQFGVARYNTDGSPDSTFGFAGTVRSLLTGYSAGSPAAVALQSNGDIVAAGQVYFTGFNQYYPRGFGSTNFAVVRYLPSAPRIGTLSAALNADGSTTLTASNLSDANPNSNVRQVAFFVQVNGTNTLLGYGTLSNGTWTISFSTSGWAAGTYRLVAQATDSYGIVGDPLALDISAP